MRVLFIDIDSLRPDHLGCYGYHRNTSPVIDDLASGGVRFTHCHAPDVPCLASRTALMTGQFGIHNGVINHGGVAADLHVEGRGRAFRSRLGRTSFMACLARRGLHTAAISPFAERHSAWWWYANFREMHNTGKGGMESAEEVSPVALDWIARNGAKDDWYLHVNYWDPHTPYRVPASFGDPFAKDPLPEWLTEEVRRRHWAGCGPHSAREVRGFGPFETGGFPRQPDEISSMDEVRKLFDGYDAGVRYADEHVGRLLEALKQQGVLDETVVVVTADHGENLGELNIYGDHQTADEITSRVPLIVRWPGMKPRVDDAFLYQGDFAATLVEMLGGEVPAHWDYLSHAPAFRQGCSAGRPYLVVSQGSWSCQRAVRFDRYLYLRSYHDGYHAFPDRMLFDLARDPHEQHDLAPSRPEVVTRGASLLEEWHAGMMRTASHPVDPMQTVLREGGPFHTRGELGKYRRRLEDTGRGEWAAKLRQAHPDEP